MDETGKSVARADKIRAPAAGNFLEIVAGTERLAARAGKNGHKDAIVLLDVIDGGFQRARYIAVDRIARVGAVDRHKRDMIRARLDYEWRWRRVAHGRLDPHCGMYLFRVDQETVKAQIAKSVKT